MSPVAWGTGDEPEPPLLCDLLCKPGGEELGVEVVGNHIILGAEQPRKVGDGLLQVFERRRVSDISHVGRGDGKSPFEDRRVRVDLFADTENAAGPKVYGHPFRGDPPGEPEDIAVPHDRVIHPFVMVRLWTRKIVRILWGEFRERHVRIGDHRVAGHVRARHDQERVFHVREEEVMEPGVGQHAADCVQGQPPALCEA